MISLRINNVTHDLEIDPQTPLLWAIRDHIGLTGTKYGCGYCQSGMIMATVALLAAKPAPTDQDIDEHVTNICRCGTYVRIRKANHRAAKP